MKQTTTRKTLPSSVVLIKYAVGDLRVPVFHHADQLEFVITGASDEVFRVIVVYGVGGFVGDSGRGTGFDMLDVRAGAEDEGVQSIWEKLSVFERVKLQ